MRRRFDELLFMGTCVMAFGELVAVFVGLPVLAEACAVSLVTFLGLWIAVIADCRKVMKAEQKRVAAKRRRYERICSRNAVANVSRRGTR